MTSYDSRSRPNCLTDPQQLSSWQTFVGDTGDSLMSCLHWKGGVNSWDRVCDLQRGPLPGCSLAGVNLEAVTCDTTERAKPHTSLYG